MANFWKRISTHQLLDHPRIKIVEDDVILPTGTHTQYLRFEDLSDYVTVIPERDGKLALIREYSYPHDEWLWQFVEGSIEEGETSEQAAKRELLEEAALASSAISLLGTNYGHHRRSTEKNFIYLAASATDEAEVTGDEEEHGTETHWFTIAEVKKMLQDGTIVQKNAQAALSLYFLSRD